MLRFPIQSQHLHRNGGLVSHDEGAKLYFCERSHCFAQCNAVIWLYLIRSCHLAATLKSGVFSAWEAFAKAPSQVKKQRLFIE